MADEKNNRTKDLTKEFKSSIDRLTILDVPQHVSLENQASKLAKGLAKAEQDPKRVADRKEARKRDQLPKELVKLDIRKALGKRGLTFDNVAENGSIIGIDNDGNKHELDVRRDIANDKGKSLRHLNFQFNDPSDPLQKSPVSIYDRFRLKALGNTEGNVEYLNNRFDEVRATNNGIIVNNSGVWSKVDPTYFGDADPWQVTTDLAKNAYEGKVGMPELKKFFHTQTDMGSEFLKDIADISDIPPAMATSMLGTIMGGQAGGTSGMAAGMMMGGLPGAVAGALSGIAMGAAGGNALASGLFARVRNSWGRAEGTYVATPEDQLGDEVTEAAIGLVAPGMGKLFGKAAKPTMEMLGKAFQKIGDVANAPSKAALKTILSQVHSVSEDSIEALFESGSKVIGRTKHLANKMAKMKAKNPTQLIKADDIAHQEQKNLVTHVLNKYPKVIDKQMDGFKDVMVNHPSIKNTIFNVGKDADDAIRALSASGVITKNKKGILEMSDNWLGKSMGIEDVTVEARKTLSNKTASFLETLQSISKKGDIRGSEGAKQTLAIRRQMGKMMDDMTKYGTDGAKELGRVLKPIHSEFRNSMNDYFKNSSTPVKQAFNNFNDTWSKNSNMLTDAQKIIYQSKYGGIAQKSKLDSFTKQAAKLSGPTYARINEMTKAANMTGVGRQLRDIRASVEFVDNFKLSWKGAVGLGGLTAVNPGAAAVVSPLVLSPRYGAVYAKGIANTAGAVPNAMGKSAQMSIPVARAMRDQILKLSPAARAGILNDNAAFAQLVGPLVNSLFDDSAPDGARTQENMQQLKGKLNHE